MYHIIILSNEIIKIPYMHIVYLQISFTYLFYRDICLVNPYCLTVRTKNIKHKFCYVIQPFTFKIKFQNIVLNIFFDNLQNLSMSFCFHTHHIPF